VRHGSGCGVLKLSVSRTALQHGQIFVFVVVVVKVVFSFWWWCACRGCGGGGGRGGGVGQEATLVLRQYFC